MFRTGGAAAFYAAWQELRKQGEIPHFRTVFSDLTPELISRLMIFEETSPDGYLVRFMGTTFLDLWREELTGKDLLALLPPPQSATARKNMAAVLNHSCGVRVIGKYATPAGSDVEMECILLPVGNDEGRPRRILGFTQELDGFRFTASGEAHGTRNRAWIDLGRGVPAHPPAT